MTDHDHDTDTMAADEDLDLLVAAMRSPLAEDPALDGAEESVSTVSRARFLARLDLESGARAGARTRRRMPRIALVAALIAAAAVAAIALAPTTGEDGGRGAASGDRATLPASADAAAVLAWAGDEVVAEGGSHTRGDGLVWHGVARTYLEGELVSTGEKWFDVEGGTFLMASTGFNQADGERFLLIDRLDADGIERVRTFDAGEEGDDWGARTEDGPHDTLDIPPGLPKDGAQQSAIATATMAWLEAASGEPSRGDFRAATAAFTRGSGEFFEINPEIPEELIERQETDAAQEEMHRIIELQRVSIPTRQIAYLMTSVHLTSEATRALYADLGTFDQLERLPDVTVDGRRAVRVLFDPTPPTPNRWRERVLVIDAQTGQLLRTETIDRQSWTEFEQAGRVASLGDDAATCGDEPQPPCELVEGEGVEWAAADAAARSELNRRAVHMGGFDTSRQVADASDLDGVMRSQSPCTRDPRLLTICRG